MARSIRRGRIVFREPIRRFSKDPLTSERLCRCLSYSCLEIKQQPAIQLKSQSDHRFSCFFCQETALPIKLDKRSDKNFDGSSIEHYHCLKIAPKSRLLRHTVRNLQFLSKNSTLISREHCRFFG